MQSTHFAMVAFGTLTLVLGAAGAATHIQHGKVVTADGEALEGVSVRGVSIKNTALQKSVQTDKRGNFSWSITTSVFHLYKDGYEPLIVVRPDASVPRRVVMIPDKREKSFWQLAAVLTRLVSIRTGCGSSVRRARRCMTSAADSADQPAKFALKTTERNWN